MTRRLHLVGSHEAQDALLLICCSRIRRLHTTAPGFLGGEGSVTKAKNVAVVPAVDSRALLHIQIVGSLPTHPSAFLRTGFIDEMTPEAHQDELLFLPHDNIGVITFKYALIFTDLASYFKEMAQAIVKFNEHVQLCGHAAAG